MNSQHTIHDIKLRDITWRLLYSISTTDWQLSISKDSLEPDFRFALREMELNGLLTVTDRGPEDPDFFTWIATDKLRDLWNVSEDEIKTLLEI